MAAAGCASGGSTTSAVQQPTQVAVQQPTVSAPAARRILVPKDKISTPLPAGDIYLEVPDSSVVPPELAAWVRVRTGVWTSDTSGDPLRQATLVIKRVYPSGNGYKADLIMSVGEITPVIYPSYKAGFATYTVPVSSKGMDWRSSSSGATFNLKPPSKEDDEIRGSFFLIAGPRSFNYTISFRVLNF